MNATDPRTITALLIVHIAGVAAWSGLLLAFLVQRVSDERTASRLLDVSILSMSVTLAAGWALAFAQQGTPDQWSWAVNAMQALGIAMAAILLVARYGALMLLQDAEERAGADDDRVIASRRLTRLVAMDLALGVAALAIAVVGRYG